MKTLFCIIGNLRAGDLCFESFNKNFPNVDLALCVGNTYPESKWRARAKYIWELDESDPEIWFDIFDRVSTQWRGFKHYPNLWGPYQGLKGSGMIIMAFRQMLYEHLLSLDETYDRYVLTRSDHLYTFGALPSVKPGEIYIPEGEEYGGVTDRFSVAARDEFLKSLQIIEFLQTNYPHQPDLQTGDPRWSINVERWLKLFYEQSGLKIIKTPRNMYTVARKDEQTRWKGPSLNIQCPHEGYYFKYPKEYVLAMEHHRQFKQYLSAKKRTSN